MELTTAAPTALMNALPDPLPGDHQELMNLFYKEWQDQNERRRADELSANIDIPYIDQEQIARLMPGKINIAVMLGNWNYQVHNGGYMQWDDNRYSGAGPTILDYLENARRVGVEGLNPLIKSLQEGLKEIKIISDYDDEDWDEFYAEPQRWDDYANRLLWDNDPEPKLQAALDAYDQIEGNNNYSRAFRGKYRA